MRSLLTHEGKGGGVSKRGGKLLKGQHLKGVASVAGDTGQGVAAGQATVYPDTLALARVRVTGTIQDEIAFGTSSRGSPGHMHTATPSLVDGHICRRP